MCRIEEGTKITYAEMSWIHKRKSFISQDYLNYFLIYIKSQDSVMRQEIRTLTRCFFCTLAEKLQHSDLVTYLCNFIVMHFFSFCECNLHSCMYSDFSLIFCIILFGGQLFCFLRKPSIQTKTNQIVELKSRVEY